MPGAEGPGDLAPSLAALVEPLRADPARAALLFDFDGTLSPTVADPAEARPAEGVAPLLGELADRYRTVALVSGRPVAFLAPLVPAGIVLSGQYGLERREADGTVVRHPAAVGVDLDAVVDDLRALGVAADAIEPKGLSVTVHYRTRPADEPLIRDAVGRVAGPHGLVVHDAKQSVELRVPAEVDKGTVVHELAAGAAGVLYVGDDLGDVPAFAALAVLRSSGVATASVAVRGPEAPPEVLASADAAVEGTEGVVHLLRSLATSSD